MFCVLVGSTAWAARSAPPLELETFEPMKQEIISEDRELTIQSFEEETETDKQELVVEECDIEPTKEGRSLEAMINKYVEFGGGLEVEYFWIKDFEDDTVTDISLETAELDFEIQVVDWATGVLALEFIPEDDKVSVKEAFVTFGDLEKCPLFLETGKIFVPFGISTGAIVGDTLSISDPLTIEVFETREDVLLLGFEKCGFNAGVYVFNGDTNKGGGNDHIEHYGATIRYGKDEPDLAYSLGIDFINSVFDSDGLTEEFEDALEADYAPGIALHGRYYTNGFSCIVEYNGAFETASFTVDDEDVSLAPKAWQIEVGYETKICCYPSYFALNYSRSYELHGAFPKKRILATVGCWLYEDNILVALEYGHDEDYSKSNGGTGKTADSIISQLVYEW